METVLHSLIKKAKPFTHSTKSLKIPRDTTQITDVTVNTLFRIITKFIFDKGRSWDDSFTFLCILYSDPRGQLK